MSKLQTRIPHRHFAGVLRKKQEQASRLCHIKTDASRLLAFHQILVEPLIKGYLKNGQY